VLYLTIRAATYVLEPGHGCRRTTLGLMRTFLQREWQEVVVGNGLPHPR